MDCEKVRDRFSSLWEEELSPSEEKVFKEHLSSCPACQKEFEQFKKTMQWLHSAGEVEVPEEFLPGLHQKLEEKKRGTSGQRLAGRWFHVPLSFKLPVQAVAMVVVVFLVLYVTKMIPVDGYRLKESKQPSSPVSAEKESEKVLDQSEVKEDRREFGRSTETTRPKDVEQAKLPVPREGKSDEAAVPQTKAEAEKREALVRGPEGLGYPAVDSKKAAKLSVPSPEPAKPGRKLASPERSRVASIPPQEILLRISDRKKAIPLLHELVKQFGGEMVTTQGDMFLASIPTVSFRGFEKELAGIRSAVETDPLIAKKQGKGSLRLEEEIKKEGDGEKSGEPARLAVDAESRTIVQILLVEE